MKHKQKPYRAQIVLKYSDEVYLDAKSFVLEKIWPYEDKLYFYNDYNFYINLNFMMHFLPNEAPKIPKWFTMVCYNDHNKFISFLGFCGAHLKLENKYLDDFFGNFESFIDEYYGEYYNFNE